MIDFQLRGKRVLVTGAAAGIGLAVAERFALAGARVVMNDLPSRAVLEPQVSRLRAAGCDVFAVYGDISVPEQAAEMVCDAIATLGGLDYLINNAGAPGTPKPIPPGDLDALTPQFWTKMLEINLLGAFWVTKAAQEALRSSGGAIVNTASDAVYSGRTSSAAYACAKAGLVQLTRQLAVGLAPEVRVNAVAPGYVNSSWQCSFGDKEALAEQSVPLARVGEPREYADLIVFLAVGATYMTGETVISNGGSHL